MPRTTSTTLTALFIAAAGTLLAGCGEDAQTSDGAFAPVADAPADAESAKGDATMERRDDGTTVKVELTGLQASGEYVAHVHNQPCDQDSGGKHYQFETGGSELPPNEIHLALAADAGGKASATTEADRKAGPEAVSIVVHYQDKKLLCADL